ncbi:MAG TPA: SLC13 family permease [Syntrophales bacterium]|nr:SLC13 family permease [Syntrophales bacterium]
MAEILISEKFEFVLFGLMLIGVALFHRHAPRVGLAGLALILLHKFLFVPDFQVMAHIFGETSLLTQIVDKEARQGEWAILLNLLGLLLGFAILSKHFEESHIPKMLTRFLPEGWKGPLLLLIIVFILSSFLDNIAAAIIGGTLASVVFKNRVHIGYLAAIVAASNAGGAGSVLGDTTTTMIWIEGVAAFSLVHAYVAAIPCLIFFALFASLQQNKFQPLQKTEIDVRIDWLRIIIVAMILVLTIITNVLFYFPALGVWIAILIGAAFRQTAWYEIRIALSGTVFLLALIFCASLMPVDSLPKASWQSTFALGFLSSVFDNIPLTKLALDQGGHDWGMLAYTVGFGGSMTWFGSSAGVAICSIFPEAKSVVQWLLKGWHITLAYIIGFFTLLVISGWQPR